MQHPEGSDKLRRISRPHLRKQGRAKNAGGRPAPLKISQFVGRQSAQNGRIRTAHYHVSTTSGHAHARATTGPAPSPAIKKASFLFFGHSRLLFLFCSVFAHFFVPGRTHLRRPASVAKNAGARWPLERGAPMGRRTPGQRPSDPRRQRIPLARPCCRKPGHPTGPHPATSRRS